MACHHLLKSMFTKPVSAPYCMAASLGQHIPLKNGSSKLFTSDVFAESLELLGKTRCQTTRSSLEQGFRRCIHFYANAVYDGWVTATGMLMDTFLKTCFMVNSKQGQEVEVDIARNSGHLSLPSTADIFRKQDGGNDS